MAVSYENFVELANAIIQIASADYCEAYKVLKMNPDNRDAKHKLFECRRFFRSKWYGTLTTLDGNVLMEMLENQCDEGIKRRTIRKMVNVE